MISIKSFINPKFVEEIPLTAVCSRTKVILVRLFEMEVKKIEEALKELRAEKKRKFIQTVDLIVNLKNFDARKEQLNTFIQIPNPAEKKICGFFPKKTGLIDVITKEDFKKFKDPKEMKQLVKKYDFFVATASLMGDIATSFGRILGPVGKMPSPQAGIIQKDDEASIKGVVEKMKKMIRIRTKEKSVKISVGKEEMSDQELKQNIEAALVAIENILPKKNDNIKEVLIKFTMSKTVRIK